MKRYFYLFCLLLAVKSIICYDYTSDHGLKHKHDRRINKKERLQHHKPRHQAKHVYQKHQEYELVEDKEPIAQIDVASFIHKPDDFALDEHALYDGATKKSNSKLTYDYGSLSQYNSEDEIEKRSNKRPYYQNPATDKPFDLGPNPFPYKDTINSRHLNLDSLSLHGLNNGKIARNLGGKATSSYDRALYDADSNIVHNPEKKCALKQMMKIPFFSHNKSESGKPKKAKKRKLFCFNCSTKKAKENKLNELSTETGVLKEGVKKEDIEAVPKVTLADTGEILEELKSNQGRFKRQEWLSDHERQLKELEDIQRKVDSVEIMSTFGKMPEAPTD